MVPSGVNFNLADGSISAKGPKGALDMEFHPLVEINQEQAGDGAARLVFKARDGSKQARALAGTTRALVNNLVNGVATGFQKKLTIIGVGYRAQAQGQKLNLTLGFSHPVVYAVPEGITVETPTQTEIVVSGASKQLVGQAAAEIRAYRPPEPYKGKGVRYTDEYVMRKQAKKK
jgi:large subunit ribosomal protein L6